MTNLSKRVLVMVAVAGVAVAAAGCEKKKKKAAPPPAPPPAPVIEIPKPVDVQALMQEMRSDPRVKFVEEQAPADRGMAEGVIKLANALAKGDAGAMKGMLDRSAQLILDELVSEGDWANETKAIEQVRIVSLSNTTEAEATSTLVGMAIQVPGEAYLLAWNGKKQGGSWMFTNALSQGETKPRASDFDGVAIQTTALPPADPVFNRPDAAAPGSTAPAAGAPAGDAPSNPRRRNTPGGPIDVPGGGR
ncbi:MAG: hypothetical protein KF678_11540 [Phycisphaeraceae bacterium]|nr:hypothetical protein [Phycisphaeraceae bacterium]